VPAGSVRIASNIVGDLQNVAFKTPNGQKVLIIVNSGRKKETFNIKCNQKSVIATLSAGDVATYVWQ
jgi:glucosylceramidase